MISITFLILGGLILILGVLAGFTKNEKLMSKIIRRKADESDEKYIKRATVMSVIMGLAVIACGLVYYI